MFVQLEYDVGCGKVGLTALSFSVFRTQKKNQKVYARMYPSVHKNVLRRTQKVHRAMHFPSLPYRYKTGLNSI